MVSLLYCDNPSAQWLECALGTGGRVCMFHSPDNNYLSPTKVLHKFISVFECVSGYGAIISPFHLTTSRY